MLWSSRRRRNRTPEGARMRQQFDRQLQAGVVRQLRPERHRDEAAVSVGQISYDAAGRMSAQLMRSDRETLTEPRARVHRLLRPVQIDAAQKIVTHIVEGSVTASMVGRAMPRHSSSHPTVRRCSSRPRPATASRDVCAGIVTNEVRPRLAARPEGRAHVRATRYGSANATSSGTGFPLTASAMYCVAVEQVRHRRADRRAWQIDRGDFGAGGLVVHRETRTVVRPSSRQRDR